MTLTRYLWPAAFLAAATLALFGMRQWLQAEQSPAAHHAVHHQAVSAINKLLEALEDHDDVKEVYSNAEFPDEIAKT